MNLDEVVQLRRTLMEKSVSLLTTMAFNMTVFRASTPLPVLFHLKLRITRLIFLFIIPSLRPDCGEDWGSKLSHRIGLIARKSRNTPGGVYVASFHLYVNCARWGGVTETT